MAAPPHRQQRLVTFILVLVTAVAILALTNCQTQPNQTTPTTPVNATATAAPPGLSRENPLNSWQTISLKNWDVRVTGIIRSPEAWKQIHDANQFNEPPPTGYEYILVQYELHRKGSDQTENSLGLHLTGSANKLHYSFNNSVVPPDPILDSYLLGGENSQGWRAYLIQEDESDLMVVMEDLSDYEEPDYFARLDETAELSVPHSLSAIQTTNAGRDFADPLPFGQIATGEDWQIMLQEIEQGPTAWTMVQAANQFNDPPPDGQMYLLIKVSARYIGENSLGEILNNSDFALVNHDNQQIQTSSVSGLEESLLFMQLYPGGEFAGWLAFLIREGDTSLVLQFSPDFSGHDNRRYLSWVQSGR